MLSTDSRCELRFDDRQPSLDSRPDKSFRTCRSPPSPREAERRSGRTLADYDALHAWSVEDPARSGTWSGISAASSATRARAGSTKARRCPATRFFPDARLNFAENLLRGDGRPATAMVFRGEDKVERRLSWDELARAGLALAAGDAGGRRRRRRPGGGDDAEHARGDRGDARGSVDRRDLVVLLARFRRARRARPLRPDRAEAVRRLRRLLVQRQAHRGRRQARRRSRRSFRAPSKTVDRALSRTRGRGGRGELPRGVDARRVHRAVRGDEPSTSSGCRSTTRSTSCSRRARPACRNASSTAPAARCSST